jgi:uncharacterized protein
MMNGRLGDALTALAREAVATGVRPDPPPAADLVHRFTPDGMRLLMNAPAATFVTLENDGALRGCIGTLEAVRPLGIDVVRNARLAAHDPRLPPVAAEECPALTVSVSVLSPSAALGASSFTELLGQLRPGVDGVTLREERRRATFLPTVWRSLPDPRRFIAALLRKGGWPRPRGLAAERYTTEVYVRPAD